MSRFSDIIRLLTTFMTMKTIVFQNKKTDLLRNFVPFIVCLLPSLVKYRPNMTLLLGEYVERDWCHKI